ncbi:unnamed protein product [Closterium sp. NIES-53]
MGGRARGDGAASGGPKTKSGPRKGPALKPCAGAGDPRAGGAGAGGARGGGTGAGGTVQWRPFFVPPPPSSLPPLDSVLLQVLNSPLPALSPYVEQTDSLTERREPESRPASLVRAVQTGRCVPCPRPPPDPSIHIMALTRSLPPLPPSPAPPCLPCTEGRQHAAPHSSSFPPMTAPLQTLHMDVWGPACVSGQGRERYFLLVVDDYKRYTTVFPLRNKGEVPNVLILWIRAVRLQLRERSTSGPVSPCKRHRLHYVGQGRLAMRQCFGSGALVPLAFVSADKLSSHAICCVFLGFPPDVLGWRFYHPTMRGVLPSQDVTFDVSVPFYHLIPYCTAPLPPPPLFLAPGPPLVDPLPPQGPAPSGVSQVDPLPLAEPIEVTVDSCAAGGGAARGAASGGAEPAGAEPGVVEPVSAEPGGAESEGAEPGGAGGVSAVGVAAGGVSAGGVAARMVSVGDVVGGGVSAGGVARGGVCAGGVAAGGVSAGGVAAGGVSAGGVAAGGVSARGVAAGGVAAGVVSAGGVAGGGVSPGGVAAGGVSAGGVAAGGVCAGGVAGGGVSAGGVAGGGVYAGGVAAGGVSAGGVAAGGVSAGGVAAGDVSAGCVAAGGVSAGGVTAGGVCAGGDFAGGVAPGIGAAGGVIAGGSACLLAGRLAGRVQSRACSGGAVASRAIPATPFTAAAKSTGGRAGTERDGTKRGLALMLREPQQGSVTGKGNRARSGGSRGRRGGRAVAQNSGSTSAVTPAATIASVTTTVTLEGTESGGVEPEGTESGCAEPRGTASAGGPTGALPGQSRRREPLSPRQLRKWFARRTRLWSGSTGVGGPAAGGSGAKGARATSPGGVGGTAGAGSDGAGGSGGAGAAGSRGARTGGTGAANAGGAAGARGAGARGAGAGGTGAEDAGSGDARAGGTGAGGTGAGGAGAGDPGASGAGARGLVAGGAGAGGAGAGGTGAGGTVQRRPFFVPPPPSSLPPLGSLQPDSPLPAPSPYTEQTYSLTERREPASRPALPVRAVRTGPGVPRPLPVPGTHTMALRPSSVPLRVPLPSPPASSLPDGPEPDPLLLVAELVDFAVACRLDYAASLVAKSASDCPPSVGGECALCTDVLEDRQEDFECLAAAVPHLVAMLLAPEGDLDAPDIPTPRSYVEAITGTYVDAVPPLGANIVDGMWIFRMTTLRVLLHVATQRDYELQSLDFSIAFLEGSLHEEIWLSCPPGFSGMTLAALGFAPLTADPSLFLRTDTSLPLFYILLYVDDLFFATANTEALALVKLELQKRHTCIDLDEFVEPSGPYPELVGCLKYPMTCTRPVLAYPLSILASYVAPGRHQVEHWEAAIRVLRYLCSTSGMGLVLGGQGPVVLSR